VKWLVTIGILLVLLGGALFVIGEIPYEEKHEANVFGAEISVTTQEGRRIPVVVSGTFLALGAVLTLVGAFRARGPR
jgi:hypothetical protein